MSQKEDLLNALEYGKDEYYQAIQNEPAYQTELARVQTDYNERSWIDFSGFIPKFTTSEFEQRQIAYQAKYGNTVNVPGFSDVIHIVPKARISAEERAAHLFAIKRGLPSPLTQEQLNSLKYKKFRFLKALASATPTIVKNIGAVSTVLDNVEDGLVTISVLGRIAAKIAPKLMGRTIPVVGWVLLGADILNALNLASWISTAAMAKKRNMEALAEKNPFHSKAAARRASKLKRAIPSFGEYLEILQTTDQLFGVGLCLGGLMGVVTDATTKIMTFDAQKSYADMPKTGNLEELNRWAYDSMAIDVEQWKKGLKYQWTNFENEAYRLKATDMKIRNDIYEWTRQQSKKLWEWVKTPLPVPSEESARQLTGSMVMSTGQDDYLKEDHTKAYMMLDSSIQVLGPWWIENDPISNFKNLRSFKFRAPDPEDITTRDMLEKADPLWEKTVKWPHLDQEYATIEELTYTYAPLIKTSFQNYCLRYDKDFEAMIAAQQATAFTHNVIKAFSDDNTVQLGMSAFWAVTEDMARESYIIPPRTPPEVITELGDYISDYERATGVAPSIQEVAAKGTQIGIDWMRSPPENILEESEEIYPGLKEIQDQLGEIFIGD